MQINIGWLYPDLMSTYGDRGNIITLSYRLNKMGVKPIVNKISINEPGELILKMDIIFMGGAQDKQQEIVNIDLKNNKGKYLKAAIENGIPSLFVCGAYQFLGKYYKAADGTIIDGLGAFDLYTENPGLNAPRCIGNIIVESKLFPKIKLVGFENHGGRTYLADKKLAFAKVIKGFGNNGEDKTEGIFYKNSFGTYLHGPILPKNPELSDYLIKKAIDRKYGEKIKLKKIDSYWENKARDFVISKL
ncbi:cobalamin biosynthesis protein CobQ [Candidatus Roizmanbacteria bacterium]|nr:cobalamin biosynthesis protein CobQ [Candidatus Roizmanbacteria bacterium]